MNKLITFLVSIVVIYCIIVAAPIVLVVYLNKKFGWFYEQRGDTGFGLLVLIINIVYLFGLFIIISKIF